VDAQTFAEQLIEQGKKAKVFGGDGSYGRGSSSRPGVVRLELRAGHHGIPTTRRSIAGWKKDNPGKTVGSFGPPTYGAVQVILSASSSPATKSTARSRAGGDRAQASSRSGSELDPRRNVPLVDEVERPAEREVLHLPDPVERPLQARRLGQRIDVCGPACPGRTRLRGSRVCRVAPEVHRAHRRRADARSVYALIALGYTLVYGVLKLLNFAHGDVVMIGSYIGFGMLQLLGGTTNPAVPVWALLILITVVAMAGCAAIGVAIERFAYRPLRDAPRIAPLISALGVSFFLSYSMQLLFGAQYRDYDLFSLPGNPLF
jgi:hypothetical protein